MERSNDAGRHDSRPPSPTPDLYANSSLHDLEPRERPLPPSQRQQELTQAQADLADILEQEEEERLQQEEEERLEQEEEDRLEQEEEERLEQEEEERQLQYEDHRLDQFVRQVEEEQLQRRGPEHVLQYERLQRHRDTRREVLPSLDEALTQWKEAEPEAFERFGQHMLNCYLATFTRVRAFDMMLWYKDMPDPVVCWLMAVLQHDHLEAYHQVKLDTMRRESDYPLPSGCGVDGEIVLAAHYTKVTWENPDGSQRIIDGIHTPIVVDFEPFGTRTATMSTSVFRNSFAVGGHDRRRLDFISANFAARRVKLEGSANRYNPSIYFVGSEDWCMIMWCQDAYQTLADAWEDYEAWGSDPDVVRSFEQLLREIPILCESLDQIGLAQKIVDLDKYIQDADAFKANLPPDTLLSRDTDTWSAEMRSLFMPFLVTHRQLSLFEQEHGVGVLGKAWTEGVLGKNWSEFVLRNGASTQSETE